MPKFLVLYCAQGSVREQLSRVSPEQAKAGMDLWMAWSRRVGSALVDMGAPVGDGTVLGPGTAPTKLGGYNVLQAESLDAAKKLLEGHPHYHTPGGWIEVFEQVTLPGM